MFSPFEQFEISILFPIFFNLFGTKIDLSITNSTVYFIIGISFIIFLLRMSSIELKFLPNRYQNLVELLYSFVLGLILEQTGSRAKKFFPFIFATFLLILVLNLLGLTPYGFTVTGHISVTFALAFSFFLSFILIGFKNLGLSFFRIFLPSGIPNWLAPLLVVIEVLSFLLRPLSLSIRLFANMLAGHVLLYIIASATFLFLGKSLLLSLFPFAFLLAFMVLEFGIAFLQAYVFTILLCIYLHDSYVSEH